MNHSNELAGITGVVESAYSNLTREMDVFDIIDTEITSPTRVELYREFGKNERKRLNEPLNLLKSIQVAPSPETAPEDRREERTVKVYLAESNSPVIKKIKEYPDEMLKAMYEVCRVNPPMKKYAVLPSTGRTYEVVGHVNVLPVAFMGADPVYIRIGGLPQERLGLKYVEIGYVLSGSVEREFETYDFLIIYVPRNGDSLEFRDLRDENFKELGFLDMSKFKLVAERTGLDVPEELPDAYQFIVGEADSRIEIVAGYDLNGK